MLGAQHDFRGSVTIPGVEDGTPQAGLGVGVQGADKDALGGVGGGAIARPGAAKAAGVAHIAPVGGAVDRAVKTPRIDKGLQQQQRVTEALLPIPRHAPLAQGQHPRGEVRDVILGQDRKPAVVGDQVQAVVLVAEIPPDPGVARGALPGSGGKTQQGQPLAVPGGDIPEGVATAENGERIVDEPSPTFAQPAGQRIGGRFTVHRGLSFRDADRSLTGESPGDQPPPSVPAHGT